MLVPLSMWDADHTAGDSLRCGLLEVLRLLARSVRLLVRSFAPELAGQDRQRGPVWDAVRPGPAATRRNGDEPTVALAVEASLNVVAPDLSVAWVSKPPMPAASRENSGPPVPLLHLRVRFRGVCVYDHDARRKPCRYRYVMIAVAVLYPSRYLAQIRGAGVEAALYTWLLAPGRKNRITCLCQVRRVPECRLRGGAVFGGAQARTSPRSSRRASRQARTACSSAQRYSARRAG